MRFSSYFQLNKSQGELDFVDVSPDQDLPLFIDPYAFSKRHDEFSETCHDDIVSFFSALVESIQAGKKARALELLSHLGEPNETCLGVSRGAPSGRGVGPHQAEDLYLAISKSRAAKTGLLRDITDAELFIEGIGPDKISDLTTNVLRRRFITYTQEQCALNGITLSGRYPTGPLWISEESDWRQDFAPMPIINEKRILLVPKFSVRYSMSIVARTFYRHFVLNYIRDEHLRLNSSLVRVFRKGTVRRVYKKDVEEKNPYSKDFLAEFAEKHPGILENYKALVGDPAPLTKIELDTEVNPKDVAKTLIERLRAIAPGHDGATKYHRLMSGILTFLLHPHLVTPSIEHEIHDGRKRIDILFVNAASLSIFHRMRTDPKFSARYVPIECKNYTREIGNPELDQMTGRFGHTRGLFGIVVCRKIEDRKDIIARCRDSALDGRGCILALDDSDIEEMLFAISEGRINSVENYLDNAVRLILAG